MAENVANYFATRINQYEQNIFARYWVTDPFASLIESKPFDLQLGLTPKVITSTCELPTSYPDPTASLVLATGTGNAACNPSTTRISFGEITRDYTLEVAAFDTPTICLTDIQFDFQAEQQARNTEKGLMQYATAYWADWARVHNIGMINGKVSTTGATTLSQATDSLYTFAGVTAPSVILNWSHLGYLYDQLTRIGAQQYAVGNADGAPVFSLSTGPALKRLLFQTNDLVRTTVNYLSMGKPTSDNFLPRGINQAVNGYIPNVDLTPIRYDSGMQKIYPWMNADATKGRKAVANPAYKTVANGGNAVYEVFTILSRGVYSKRPRPVGPTSASMESFNPITYAGEVRWINNPTFRGDNDQGNNGYYKMDMQAAAMPEFPEYGFAGLTIAMDL